MAQELGSAPAMNEVTGAVASAFAHVFPVDFQEAPVAAAAG